MVGNERAQALLLWQVLLWRSELLAACLFICYTCPGAQEI